MFRYFTMCVWLGAHRATGGSHAPLSWHMPLPMSRINRHRYRGCRWGVIRTACTALAAISIVANTPSPDVITPSRKCNTLCSLLVRARTREPTFIISIKVASVSERVIVLACMFAERGVEIHPFCRRFLPVRSWSIRWVCVGACAVDARVFHEDEFASFSTSRRALLAAARLAAAIATEMIISSNGFTIIHHFILARRCHPPASTLGWALPDEVLPIRCPSLGCDVGSHPLGRWSLPGLQATANSRQGLRSKSRGLASARRR